MVVIITETLYESQMIGPSVMVAPLQKYPVKPGYYQAKVVRTFVNVLGNTVQVVTLKKVKSIKLRKGRPRGVEIQGSSVSQVKQMLDGFFSRITSYPDTN